MALVVDDPAVAGYYARVFEADWPGPDRYRIHLGLVLATLLAGGAVGVHARRLDVRDRGA